MRLAVCALIFFIPFIKRVCERAVHATPSMRRSSKFLLVSGKDMKNKRGIKNRVEKKFWLKAMTMLECFWASLRLIMVKREKVNPEKTPHKTPV